MQTPVYKPNKRSLDLPLRIPQRVQPATRRSSGTTIMKILQDSNRTDIPQYRSPVEKQMEVDDYSTLQLTMTHKLKTIEDNINIYKQKSKIKDQEMQALAALIEKMARKIDNEEQKYKKKQKILQKLSIKCQGMTQTISIQQQKIKKETIYLHEQNSKYNSLQQSVQILQHSLKQSYYQLDRKQKICQGLEQLEQQNSELRQHYQNLIKQEKLIEYREQHDSNECQQLVKKIEHLNTVLKERTKINKSNQNKLSKLNRDIEHLQESLYNKKNNLMEVKDLELQIGELNQQLLLINDHISQTQFKIKRKMDVVEELRDKIYKKHEQAQLELSSKKKKNSPKKQQSMPLIREEVDRYPPKPNNQPKKSHPSPQPADLTHLTPTFPSNQIQLGSETFKSRSPGQTENDAFQNIEKLIKRYEKIKNKDSEIE